MKLSLGLIWTLIRHYQIRSSGKGLSTKEALLTWVNTLIPERKVTNFTSDWSNGISLCYLIDRIEPGLCPQHASLTASNGLENCTLAMNLAETRLEIPQIINPVDLHQLFVDEMSVMTYISQFCNPAIKKLLTWVQIVIPFQNIANFKTDWNNGINLAALINGVSPGLFPDWNSLDPNESVENLTRAMTLAQEKLEVEPVLAPEAMADPNVDELNVVTYISRFLNTKAIPLPQQCSAFGNGLSKAFAGKEAIFQVDATKAGVGSLDVNIVSSGLRVDGNISKEREGFYRVSYVPRQSGSTVINVKWGGVDVPGSPFTCTVIDAGSVSFSSPEITGAKFGKVGKIVIMRAKGFLDINDLSVQIDRGSSGSAETANVKSMGSSEAEVSYMPRKPGKDKVIVKIGKEEIPGSPFIVSVIDPNQCRLSHSDPPSNKPGIVGKVATFRITASDVNAQCIVAEAKTPSGVVPLTLSPDNKGLLASYSPLAVGSHTIVVKCDGEPIRGSPLSFSAVDPSKVILSETIPQYMHIGKELAINVSTKSGGMAQLEVNSSNSKCLATSLDKAREGMYVLKLKALKPGGSKVAITWSGYNISHSPFSIEVCDASKCSVSSIASKGKTKEPFVFTVQAKDAGNGELEVNCSGPSDCPLSQIDDNGDGSYKVSFTSYESGLHTVSITWAGETIPNSPFQVNFARVSVSQFSISGEAFKKCVAIERNQIKLLGPEPGLLTDGLMQVNITGEGKQCKTVSSVPPCSDDPNILVGIEDKGDGTYIISYTVPHEGNYTINIKCLGENISGSPFDVRAAKATEAKKCFAFGKAIDEPDEQVVGRVLQFSVDTSKVSGGSLSIVATDPQMRGVPIFHTDERGSNTHIHKVKIYPESQGEYTVDVKWSDDHISCSPFTFNVGDASKVKVLSIPDRESFATKIEEPLEVLVDDRAAKPGRLSAVVEQTGGTTKPFIVTTRDDGKTLCRYIPNELAHTNISLTFSGIDVPPFPLGADVIDHSSIKVIPPVVYGKFPQQVKFIISGIKKNNVKKLSIKASQKKQTPKVEQEIIEEGIVQARFAPKTIGEYMVEVKFEKKHVPGSPFTVYVANPDACRVIDEIPTVLPLGKTTAVSINTAECGPGELTASITVDHCLKCDFSQPSKLLLTPTSIGLCKMMLKWAEHPVLKVPVTFSIFDPSKCTFDCSQLKNSANIQENDKVEFIIDTSMCGPCAPLVEAGSNNTSYPVSMKESGSGVYVASFTPSQAGETTVRVLVAGQLVPNCPFNFEVLRKVSSQQVRILASEGLAKAKPNELVSLSIVGLHKGAIASGMLSYSMTYSEGKSPTHPPKVECTDNNDGSYTLTYTAYDIGQYKLTILYQGEHISGSPFSILVRPESQASKCVASGKGIQDGSCISINEEATMSVDSTAVGSDQSLVISATQPDGQKQDINVTEEEKNGKIFKHISFQPTKVGTYSIFVDHYDVPIPGSPFKINIVDPSRCLIAGEVPKTVQVNQSATVCIDTTGAGPGTLNVLINGEQESQKLSVDVAQLNDGRHNLNFIGQSIGEASIAIEWGGYQIPKTPFTISVCDTSACSFDANEMKKNPLQVGVPFVFIVDSTGAGDAKLSISPVEPSDTHCKISSEDNKHTVTCTPCTVGEHTLAITLGQEHIKGSPVTYFVIDPKNITMNDPVPQWVHIGKEVSISISTQNGGAGELEVTSSNPDSLAVEVAGDLLKMRALETGGSQLAVAWSGHSIFSSTIEVCDASKCHAPDLASDGKAKEPFVFTVQAKDAGNGELAVNCSGPSKSPVVQIDDNGDGSYNVSFTSYEPGVHTISITWAGETIPNSPFQVDFVQLEASQFSLGDQDISECIATERSEIKLLGPEAGLLTDGAIQVNITGEGKESKTVSSVPPCSDDPDILLSIEDEGDGTYIISYTVPHEGNYTIDIKCLGESISGSPFDVRATEKEPEFSIESITVSGDAMSKSCIGIGEQATLSVDSTAVGSDQSLVISATQPDGQKQDINVTEEEKNGKIFKHISFQPTKVGTYSIFVEVNGVPIPGSPFKINIVDPSRCLIAGEVPKTVQVNQSATVCIDTTGAGPGTLNVLINGEQESQQLSVDVAHLGDLDDAMSDKCNLNFIGKSIGEASIVIEWGGYQISRTPFTISVCDASACTLNTTEMTKKPLQVGVPFMFKVNSAGSGKGDVSIKPGDSSDSQYTIITQSDNDVHTVTCTPWTVGEQSLAVTKGEEHIKGSPLTFSVCDRRQCKITGLPDPAHFVPLLGVPIEFSIDYHLAGPGEVSFVVRLPDGSEEEQEGDEEEDGLVHYSYAPEELGSLEFLIEFNGISLLRNQWICEVPDPSIFRAIAPKGMCRLDEPVQFYVTGITKQTEDFIVTGTDPNSAQIEATKEQHIHNNSIFVVQFIATVVGEYSIQIKHDSSDIDGSPFIICVTNPAGARITGSIPDHPKVGERLSLSIDASKCGPGDISCDLIPIYGQINIEPQIVSSPDEDELYEISFSSKVVLNCLLELRLAGYLLQSSPQYLCFVDPSKVLVNCKELERGDMINQGDPLSFEIDGREGGRGTPEAKVSMGGAPVDVDLVDNRDGTFLARVTALQAADYSVAIKWSGYSVAKATANFGVQRLIDSHSITAKGNGLRNAVADQEITVVVSAYEVGLVSNNLLAVRCFDPEKNDDANDPITKWIDNDDGTYDLTIVYPHGGRFFLCIDYNDQPIYQSPFTVSVKGKPNANMCRVFGPSVDKLREGVAVPVTQHIEIHVDSSDAGSGELTYTATDPTGEQVTVFSSEEEKDGRQFHYLRLGPFDVGEYTVRLYWSGVELADSPLKFNIVDPALCLVSGLPLSNGMAQLGESVPFSLSPNNCGVDRPLVVVAVCSNEENETIIDSEELTAESVEGGVYNYEFDTSEPNSYTITVTVGGLNVPGSPFKCDIIDPTQYTICGLSTAGKYAYAGDTVSFNIQGVPPEGESFSVVAHGPHNDQICVVHGEDGFYYCTFPVIDAGSHEVYVECANKHVPGSPFQINVADPSKCIILDAPDEFQVGTKESIVVKTTEAGEGELSVLVNNEKETSVMSVEIDNTNVSTYVITFTPHRIGEVKIDILWAGRLIPQFPLNLQIYDAKQCKVFGQSLVTKKGKVGEPITFTVMTRNAGVSKLTIKASGPSAQYSITPNIIGENKHEAQFTPWQNGQHTIEIFWGKVQVPKSPFSLHIDKGSGDGTCHATGDGLKKAIAMKESKFMLFSNESGLLDKGALKVTVQSALHGENVNLNIRDERNGSYEVVYIAPNRGAYFAAVSYYDEPIPGSPFKINCVPGPDPSKCRLEGFHNNTLYIAGKPIEFTVDSSEAGSGVLKVFVQGPRDHVPKVYLADDGKGHHSVKFDALIPGRYFIVVAWSDSHIPGSPFKIKVHPGPDASKVIVTGPGIKDSILGEDSEIYIDTREAGIGTLLIKVHGVKDAFKIDANPVNEDDKRLLLATYSPTVAGSYDIFIRWSGVHVPGSPFKVQITKPGGTEEPDKKVKAERQAAAGGPQKRKPSRRPTEERLQQDIQVEEQKNRAGRRKKISTVSVEVEKKYSKRVMRSQSSSAIPVSGPIKPQLKMKRNPSMMAGES